MMRIKEFVGLAAGVALGILTGAAPGLAQGATKDVVVVNGTHQAVPVRSVDRPAETPWQFEFALDWADGVGNATSTYQVPANKRLVIEYGSYSAYLPPSGQNIFVRIQTSAGGGTLFHSLDVQARGDYGVLKQFGAAHTVKIYADAGSTVTVSAGRVPFVDPANSFMTLSGLLVDVP
jgi:hypothetical protein